jgi:hypothetical protein
MEKLSAFCLMLTIILIVSLGVVASQHFYPMTAPLPQKTVKLYNDQACTLEILEGVTYAWQESDWQGLTLSTYAKNTGLSPTTVIPSAIDLVNCTIAFSISSVMLQPNQVQQIDLTFTITVADANAVSWKLILDYGS